MLCNTFAPKGMVVHGPQKRTKTILFYPTHCFFHFSWGLPTFSAERPIPNAQNRTFVPEVLFQKSYSCVNTRYVVDVDVDVDVDADVNIITYIYISKT